MNHNIVKFDDGSGVEGHRLKWKKHAWSIRTLVAHLVMQILAYFGFYKQAMKIHDTTVPKPSKR